MNTTKQLKLKDALNEITCDEIVIINDKKLSVRKYESLNEDMEITSFEVKEVTASNNEEVTYIIIKTNEEVK